MLWCVSTVKERISYGQFSASIITNGHIENFDARTSSGRRILCCPSSPFNHRHAEFISASMSDIQSPKTFLNGPWNEFRVTDFMLPLISLQSSSCWIYFSIHVGHSESRDLSKWTLKWIQGDACECHCFEFLVDNIKNTRNIWWQRPRPVRHFAHVICWFHSSPRTQCLFALRRCHCCQIQRQSNPRKISLRI